MQTFKPTATCTALAMSLVALGAMAAPASRSDGSSQVSTVTKPATRVTVIYSFTDLDRDRDGELSRSEIPLDMVDLRMDFRRADFTEDGQLSPVECAMYANGTMPQYTGPSHAWNVVFDSPDTKGRIIADR